MSNNDNNNVQNPNEALMALLGGDGQLDLNAILGGLQGGGEGQVDLNAMLGGMDLSAMMSMMSGQPPPAAAAQPQEEQPPLSSTMSDAQIGDILSGILGDQAPSMHEMKEWLNGPGSEKFGNDPDLGPVVADMQARGISAFLDHMSNPAVMMKLGALFGGMVTQQQNEVEAAKPQFDVD